VTEVASQRDNGHLPFRHSDRQSAGGRPSVTAKLAVRAAIRWRCIIMATEGLALRRIVAKNLKNLESLRDGDRLQYSALDDIVVLGLQHDPEVIKFIAAHGNDANAGQLSVTRKKPGSTQEGTLRVERFRKNQGERKDFIAGIRLFTKMEVVFA